MSTSPACEAQFESCYARLRDGVFIIGNREIERSWAVRDGRLYATGLTDKSGSRQWVAKAAALPGLIGSAPWPAGEVRLIAEVQRHPVSRPALRVVLSRDEGKTGYVFRIFADAPAIEISLLTDAGGLPAASPAPAPAQASGIETDGSTPGAAVLADVVDHLNIAGPHLRLTQVTLQDITDAHNELVTERSWLMHPSNRTIACHGNLFFIEDTFTRDGLLLLRPAPLTHARPIKPAADLMAGADGGLTVLGHGLDTAGDEGYPAVWIAYRGGRVGRIAALQRYQRQVRPRISGRDGLLASNTWGDRSRDGRINADFMAGEIEAAGDLGVDVVQLDDGWQRGTTANSVNRDRGGVWNGFWAADPHFWAPHPQRFPRGLQPTRQHASAAGVGLGFWFAPDSSNDFANWQRDAEVLLRLYREMDVRCIKIDGVKLLSRNGERNLRRMFDAVLAGSAGQVAFDLDITAETRPGYFGMMDIGPLYVENRYTDWHNYWPHHTLRNLWKLAHYVDPLRLRMEFLNHLRNADPYGDDPLAPGRYAADYLFASIMFAAPLAFFEVSNLPPESRAQLQPLIRTWKQHREAIHNGIILPVGEEPDGLSWTGFASRAAGGGYAILLREHNDRPEWTLPCDQLGLNVRDVRVLAGDGHAIARDGQMHIHIPAAQRYIFVQFASA